jgi:oligosaccharide repeat unit polymerase
MFLKLFFSFLIFFLIIIEPDFKSIPNSNLLNMYLIIFFIATFLHFFFNKNENWFRIDVIFLLGFSIVHFQWALMYSIDGITPNDYSFFWATTNYTKYINYGTWLSTVGIIAWFLGFNTLKKVYIQNEKTNYYKLNYKIFFYFTLFAFIMFLLTAGQEYLSGAIYKGEGKSATGAGISVYFQLLFSFSIIILCTLTIFNMLQNKNSTYIQLIKNIDKKVLLLFISTIFIYLYVGDRGGALQPIIASLILYGTFIKPISKKQFFLIIFFGALLMTIIGIGRAQKSNDSILSAGLNKVEFTSNYDFTLELANSARTLYKSLSNIPEKHDYFYGKLWISQLLANIPLGQVIYLNLSGDEIYELDSASYITYTTRGKFSISGEGTSLIADIYLNFGIYGVIIFMFLFGIFFKKIVNEFELKSSLYWIITGAILASYAFYLGRGGLLYPLRPILWSILLVFIFIKRKEMKINTYLTRD